MKVHSASPTEDELLILRPAGLDTNRYGIVKGNDYIDAASACQE